MLIFPLLVMSLAPNQRTLTFDWGLTLLRSGKSQDGVLYITSGGAEPFTIRSSDGSKESYSGPLRQTTANLTVYGVPDRIIPKLPSDHSKSPHSVITGSAIAHRTLTMRNIKSPYSLYFGGIAADLANSPSSKAVEELVRKLDILLALQHSTNAHFHTNSAYGDVYVQTVFTKARRRNSKYLTFITIDVDGTGFGVAAVMRLHGAKHQSPLKASVRSN